DFSQFHKLVKSHLSNLQQIHKTKSDILAASQHNMTACNQFIATGNSSLKTDFSFASNYQVGATHRAQAEAIQLKVNDIQGNIESVNAETATLNNQITNAQAQIKKIEEDIKNRNIAIVVIVVVIIGAVYAYVS
ncbi:MAG: hypothetical protein MJK04_28885, partial [Psychrosphaera sp.]|nr:hypothetical protein [Psychrosphaera sp.]